MALPSTEDGLLSGLVAGDKLSDFRDKILWDFEDGVAVVFEGGLVLGHGFVRRLLLVVGEQPANTLFVPTWGEVALLAHLLHRLRRLNAASGFPLSSYDVTTKRLSPSGSMT